MNHVEFKHMVKAGDIIRIVSTVEKKGRTSVGYRVEVTRGRDPQKKSIFSTLVTFVNISDDGEKTSIS